MKSISFLLFVCLSIAYGDNTIPTSVLDADWEAEDAILQQELIWAEKAMEEYKRKTGSLPLRSSIRAAHVHTEAWRQDSISMLSTRNPSQEGTQRLRGSSA